MSPIFAQRLIAPLVLRRNLSSFPQDVEESAYKGLVHPVLEYGCSVWDPKDELEKVQKRAARFVTDNYIYEKWEYDCHSRTTKVGISEESKRQ